MFHADSKLKKFEVNTLISDKIDFNTKNYLQTFCNNKFIRKIQQT